MARFYRGDGGGAPLFTSDGRHLYACYGGGAPLATIVGNQVSHGYGSGQPLLTGEGYGLTSLVAAVVVT